MERFLGAVLLVMGLASVGWFDGEFKGLAVMVLGLVFLVVNVRGTS